MSWLWGTKEEKSHDDEPTDDRDSTKSAAATTTCVISAEDNGSPTSAEVGNSSSDTGSHREEDVDDEQKILHSRDVIDEVESDGCGDAVEDQISPDNEYDENDTDDDGDDGKSLHSLTTEDDDDDDISFIDSEGADSIDDDDDDGDRTPPGAGNGQYHDDIIDSTPPDARKQENINSDRLSHITDMAKEKESNRNNPGNDNGDSDNDDDDQVPSSFWEKQGLLVLAAEHDRVDILNAVLKDGGDDDDDNDKERLMNTGVPPLHLAISFSSVNTAIALLRMGADPSVRPNVQQILEQQKSQPEDSKVDIPNIERFDGASAWELAFGNAAYERFKSQKSKSWSLFGSSLASSADTCDDDDGGEDSSDKKERKRIVKPADMSPSKREGIRHAFTAEALRCVGADEVDRLMQLVRSGMPATIDIGGKDLYGWTVEMGALKCEEALRPVEAAKYDDEEETGAESIPSSSLRVGLDEDGKGQQTHESSDRENNANSPRPIFKVHRPTHETVPQLRNRLDELESLAGALSTCLDNLAEEVSVCHGLLLLGGGAAALASHVKSLKLLKQQKLDQLEEAERECLKAERELADLAHSAGDAGATILNISTSKLDFHMKQEDNGDGMIIDTKEDMTAPDECESEDEKRNLLAQIAASEHKTRKLRASIADLSEENSRDMEEVERRGLEGGINLVRGLREELRDVEFQLSEIRSLTITYRAKISMILAQVPTAVRSLESNVDKNGEEMILSDKEEVVEDGTFTVLPKRNTRSSDSETSGVESRETINGAARTGVINVALQQHTNNNHSRDGSIGSKSKTASEKIRSGESTAIQVIQSGHHGFFPVDLWQVLLRIIGFERAAYRRGMQRSANGQPNSFIV